MLRARVNATDDVGLWYSEFSIDNKTYTGISYLEPPLIWDIDTTDLTDGYHNLYFSFWDLAGKETTVSRRFYVRNIRPESPEPTINISLNNGDIVSDLTKITVQLENTSGYFLKGVEFHVDNQREHTDATYPYDFFWWDTTTRSPGQSVNFCAKAIFKLVNQWHTFEDCANVTIDPTPPNSNITSPSAGARISGTTLYASNVVDNGRVASVAFYVSGSTPAFIDTERPYGYSLNTTDYPDGNYTLNFWYRRTNNNIFLEKRCA